MIKVFNGLNCLQVKINFSSLRIRFGISSAFEMKSLHSHTSHVGHSILIYGSTQIRHVELKLIQTSISLCA